MRWELESYTKGTLAVGYKYNDQGIRTRKTVNGTSTYYILQGSNIIAETTSRNRIDYRYDGNGKLLAIRWNGNEYYYVTNVQGDVTGLIDSTGALVLCIGG